MGIVGVKAKGEVLPAHQRGSGAAEGENEDVGVAGWRDCERAWRACKGGAVMAILESLAARLPAIDSRPISQVDQEIFDELEFHIAMRTEENMNLGMTADVARSAALKQFGDFAAVKQRCRRALLGERIMWQRIQMGLSVVLLGAVAVLAVQLYNGQRANRESIDDIASALKRLTPTAAGGA